MNGGRIFGGIMGSPKCLLLTLCLLGLSIEPSWSSCFFPTTVANATIQLNPPSLRPIANKYPDGSEAIVECKPGFHLAYTELKYQTCSNGEWLNSVNPEGPTCVPNRCSRPPTILHGHYTKEKSSSKRVGGRSEDSYPLGTILEPTCEASFSLNCSDQCGRISCGIDGTWRLMDGKLISECVAEPLHVRNNLSPSEHDEGRHTDSPMKNYMVLALAAICIVGVAILTILLLRRPTFCKKQSQGPRGGVGGGRDDNPVIITSSSPVPYNNDSLPLAMNTGIFMPGAGYDLQDCHFQDSPLVGTTVFK